MEMEQAMYNHSLEILGNQQAMEILEMEMEQAMETLQSLKSTELTKARPIMDEESASKTRFTVETSCRAPSLTMKDASSPEVDGMETSNTLSVTYPNHRFQDAPSPLRSEHPCAFKRHLREQEHARQEQMEVDS